MEPAAPDEEHGMRIAWRSSSGVPQAWDGLFTCPRVPFSAPPRRLFRTIPFACLRVAWSGIRGASERVSPAIREYARAPGREPRFSHGGASLPRRAASSRSAGLIFAEWTYLTTSSVTCRTFDPHAWRSSTVAPSATQGTSSRKPSMPMVSTNCSSDVVLIARVWLAAHGVSSVLSLGTK